MVAICEGEDINKMINDGANIKQMSKSWTGMRKFLKYQMIDLIVTLS
ncbi:hypothetical protein [Paenibacillus dokdonensis]|nr:hypothetical protein [Paenibacillus dokdonensis]